MKSATESMPDRDESVPCKTGIALDAWVVPGAIPQRTAWAVHHARRCFHVETPGPEPVAGKLSRLATGSRTTRRQWAKNSGSYISNQSSAWAAICRQRALRAPGISSRVSWKRARMPKHRHPSAPNGGHTHMNIQKYPEAIPGRQGEFYSGVTEPRRPRRADPQFWSLSVAERFLIRSPMVFGE